MCRCIGYYDWLEKSFPDAGPYIGGQILFNLWIFSPPFLVGVALLCCDVRMKWNDQRLSYCRYWGQPCLFSCNFVIWNKRIVSFLSQTNDNPVSSSTHQQQQQWSDLEQNTSKIVKESNLRMQFLHKAAKFTSNVNDLKQIFMSQVRSKLEQSAVVWHNGLTKRNENDIEWVQKSALRVFLKHNYTGYQNALVKLGMQSQKERRIRNDLCLKFGKNCLKGEASYYANKIFWEVCLEKKIIREVCKICFAKHD